MQLPKRATRRRALRSDLVALDTNPDGKLRGTDNAGNDVNIFPDLTVYLLAALRGAENGVAPLGAGPNPTVPAIFLPSYVDDVLEFANFAALPTTGEAGKIYVAVNGAIPSDPSRQYRWGGSSYTEINPSPGTTDALVEGFNNWYFTNARAIAALAGTLANYLTIAAANSALTANSAADRNRENHTGQQAPSTIAGFNAAVIAALEAGNVAASEVLLADLPATPPTNSTGQLFIVQRSSTDKRRVPLVSDGTNYQFFGGSSVIDKSLDESTEMTLATSFTTFSTGTIVLPAKFIAGRREFALEFDALFSNPNTATPANQIQVTANGSPIYSPPVAAQRRTGHVCRFFMNAAGTGYKVGAALSGFGLGNNTGSGLISEIAYTAGTDITLAISALGVAGETCKLWRWRLMGFS